MTTPNPLDTHFSGSRDMLGYTPGATPSADAWLATFTRDFLAHAEGTHGAHALMSGLRFYTAAFVAEIAALPPVALRLPPIAGSVAQAIYTATQAIILDVYETQIRRQAEHADILAAFTQAMPALVAQYHNTPATDTGIGYRP
ncbi:MAG TPA: hypothetical protein VKY74_05390 [Chloroflexia bacterium]|nr:hypothetical protein [Chloroflexia bacterium]